MSGLRLAVILGTGPGKALRNRTFCGDVMYDHLIETQAKAAEIVCGRMSPSRLKALRESLEDACQLPADAGWDQKAAAHAAFFTVMAEAADDPVSALVLAAGADLAYDLMVTAGRTASQIVINSRRRVLDHLRTGDAAAAALELGNHLRTLQFMGRLTGTRRDEGPATRDRVLSPSRNN